MNMTTRIVSNAVALCVLVVLLSACRTSKSAQQSVSLEKHDSVHNEYRYAKTLDSLVSIKVHNQEDVTVIREIFIPVRDTTGQITGSVLAARIRIVARSEKDSTAVFLHSENEEEQQQVSAITDTHIETESKEDRKTSTGPPWMFFAFLFVLIVLFAGKLKN
ncbi:hypothetical protein EZS27_004588 [termite gut metagenome]|uniref:Lipoprotein n=1 Tax=termite gut metagenome TaxID=433724 RepID=A0A5J4SPM6_9ZZZZ